MPKYNVQKQVSVKPSMPWFRQIWAIKDTLIIVFTPLVFLPILICFPESKAARCAYTIIIMAIYWMTEVINMAVTALIPIVLFPWLGVMSSKDVCTNYLKDANMLFFGGLLVAIAVEKWNLHKRVALRVLMLVGSKPLWIVFGFMSVTCFLSMWLNNTATTAMMMPIAQAVLKELDDNRKRQLDLQEVTVENGQHNADGQDIELQVIEAKDKDVTAAELQVNGTNKTREEEKMDKIETFAETDPLSGGHRATVDRTASDKDFMAFRKALKLCIPYASSIGGTGTLIGSGPNIVLKGQLEAMYKGAETGINFTSWLVIGFPAMLIDIIGAWLLLLVIFLGPKTFGCGKKGKPQDDSANQVIRTEYGKLGKITFAEVVVLVNFLVLALLWLTREPEFVPGWGSLLPPKLVTDASCAITISVLLFLFPSQFPNYLCFRRKKDVDRAPGPAPAILDWPTVNKQMPWSVIILLGGGFALADACMVSGLSTVIGDALSSFRFLPPWVIVMIMCLLATLITSFTSNMATTTIFIPILAELARSTCINPIYLMLPVTLAASWAYILPVSTPPNAIAYSYGDLVIGDLMKAGLAMCVLCNAVLLFSINTWGYSFFNLATFPDWAATPGSNCTVSSTFNETLSALGNSTNF